MICTVTDDAALITAKASPGFVLVGPADFTGQS